MTTELSPQEQGLPELHNLASNQKSHRLNDSLFSKELAPHYMQLASQLSKSSMVPKAYQGKPQDLFIAMAMGYQIGLSVEQSVQAIAVINGKPCLWGDDMLALCMAHSDFQDIIESPFVKDGVIGSSCTIKRKGMEDHTVIFDMNMAKKAGLLSKQGPWTQYPERMLQLRARGFALRDRFPDALKGIKSREEVEDYIEAEYTVSSREKPSRTELLKNDFLTKTGQLNETNETIEDDSDLPATQEATERNEPETVGETGKQETLLPELLGKIITLIDEKGFSDERLSKALAYYEIGQIEELTLEQSQHFIAQLNKS